MRPTNNRYRGVNVCCLCACVVLWWCNLASSQAAEKSVPDAPKPATAEKKNFFARWAEFYRQDWSGSATSSASSSPAPARRGAPSPLDSPPFPNADWSYGGSPVIGEPDTNSYPLMTAINGATSRTKVYGWVDPSLNFSTSTNRNEPEANDVYSNRFELNQLVLYAERLPDSVQQDHVDWGYHLTALFGTDYRFTTAKGYGSGQWVNDHHQYGFDPTLEYVDIYFPHVGQGMNLRFGRFISVPGIEAQLAPNNYIFSHSLLYAIDPFTDTGLMATVKLNDHWLVQLGITDGHDVALWTPDAKPSGTACFNYTTTSVNDNFYVCANGINDGKYAYNNLQQYDATWYHKFSKTWHMATETWYMYERDVPALGGPIQPEAWSQSGVLSARRTAVHRSRICGGQFLAEGTGHARLPVVSQRLSRRQERAADRLRDAIHREHNYVVSLDRHDDSDPSGVAVRAGLGHEGLRLWPAAESADRGQRSDFSFLNCAFSGGVVGK